jgi:hypothetical protein
MRFYTKAAAFGGVAGGRAWLGFPENERGLLQNPKGGAVSFYFVLVIPQPRPLIPSFPGKTPGRASQLTPASRARPGPRCASAQVQRTKANLRTSRGRVGAGRGNEATKPSRYSDEKMRLLRDLRPLAMTQAAFFCTLLAPLWRRLTAFTTEMRRRQGTKQKRFLFVR